MSKLLGGWSMSLTRDPLNEFDYMMYGMVTNLDGLTTGTASRPGWSPEKSAKPQGAPGFKGQTLWVYGGGGCSPQEKPSDINDVSRIVAATVDKNWDGVDFDDECNMNMCLVIEAMKQLKEHKKETSFGFIAGYSYNHPTTASGKKLNQKVSSIIASGQCNRLIHYCYAAAMWNKDDILGNVRQALERSLAFGIEKEKVILALTSRGLTDWNLNYFLDQVIDLDIGGLFIWRYDQLSADHLQIIRNRLGK
ncbi:hypothetical protein N5W20_04465 [Candidatus Kirkpatrickella diaphorinae]|uniref:Uncharacterized protein n=1 Tax=Candidatus Kirkpatrickella diaphorinae TaxID=2984322 RepID=A0ABY6GKP8_9PROT|nr:hypothetical protein [Candidatus Kirkpatrickella diaphorinae]UYH52112.1 hypothetical protein N5W20_04465 [Candidatus Kirkpatrickella diaphorinae]